MYIVLETQTNKDGTVGTIPMAYENENEAKSKYYAVLSAAAVSEIPVHTAFLLTDEGMFLNSECFKHEVEATPKA